MVATLLTFSNARAFDSSDAYNTITFSYRDNTYVSQQFVLSNNQKNNVSSFSLTVDAKDGGGRPTHDLNGNPLQYSSQFDTARIEIIAYNSSGGIISTVGVDQALKNYGSASNPGWSTSPGDNQHPWTQMTVPITAADVGGSFANVARIEVRLVNKNEGSYWAGNYGVQFRTPTLQADGTGNNLLYNSEFGVDSSGVKVQGWKPSYSAYSSCGTTSGSNICSTEEQGVTANMWGGGEDPNGGTTASQPGGYDATLTSDNADTAAEGGDIGGGGTTTPEPSVCDPSYVTCPADKSSLQYNATHIQRKIDWENVNTGSENIVRIQQVGDRANIDIDQSLSTGIGGNLVMGHSTTDDTANIIGDDVIVDINQFGNDNAIGLLIDGNNNDITVSQTGHGHRARNITQNGTGNTVNISQHGNLNELDGKGHFADVYIVGSNNSVTTSQWNEGQLLVVDNIADGNTISVNQKDGENYTSIVNRMDDATIGVVQEGGGDHGINLNLTGETTDVGVNQNSAISQILDITHHCGTLGGCAPISITQD